MSPPPSAHVTATALDGTDTVEMGTIVPSNPRHASIRLVLRNYSEARTTVKFTLSDDLSKLFSIGNVSALGEILLPPAHQPGSAHPATPDLDFKVWNRNLLHCQTRPWPQFQLPPSKQEHLLLHITPVAHLRASSRHPSDEPARAALSPLNRTFKGHLHISSSATQEVYASVLLVGLVCDSWIRTEMDVLDFGQCSVGVWSYADLLVNNLTDVPTTICMSPEITSAMRDPESSPLLFFDAASNKQLVPPIFRVNGLSTLRIKVATRPKDEAGEQSWLSIQNLKNPIDVWYIRVIANAMSQQDAHGVFLSCGTTMNFGDCYAYCKKSQDIVIRNDYSDTIKLSMLSDQKDQITFEILPEGLDGETFHVRTGDRQGTFDAEERSDRPIASNPLHRPNPEDSSHGLFPGMQYEKGQGNVGGSHRIANRSTAGLTENLNLFPGQQKGVRVWYLPLRRPWECESRPSRQELLSKLRQQQYNLMFKLSSGESRMVTCRSRVCESLVRLQRSGIHMGDCNVMVKYNTDVTIINCSDLQAHLRVSYVSQCVVAATHDVRIEPRATFELKLDFVPRQVNPDYHKEITFTNLRNPNADNLVFTLRANCIDTQGVGLHALFYKILAPNPTNEIDFGTTVANHPAIKSFKVRNTTQGPLALELQGCPGVTTYLLSPEVEFDEDAHGDRMHRGDFESHSTRNLSFHFSRTDKETEDSGEWELDQYVMSTKALIDIDAEQALATRSGTDCSALVRRRRKCEPNSILNDTEDKKAGESVIEESEDMLIFRGENNWEEFMKFVRDDNLSIMSSTSTQFSTYKSELKYSEAQLRPLRRLRGALIDGYLEEKQILTVEAGAEAVVVVSLTFTDAEIHESTKIRTFEKFLEVRMLEYDSNRLSELLSSGDSKQLHKTAKLIGDGSNFAPRQIVLTVQACKSRMTVAPLQQLNFGTVQVGQQKDKAFTIVNLSEAPLLYELRKLGEDTLNELRFNIGKGNRGVVRPYFSKVVPFIYAPNSEGPFSERIVIENRLDSSADCELVVKATVTY